MRKRLGLGLLAAVGWSNFTFARNPSQIEANQKRSIFPFDRG
jgi:hypothetical protein